LFREVESRILARNRQLNTDASPFELLTVTAFEIFNQEQVDVGVIEVGMGGREDATNILKDKAVTVISKIGLDHREFLGNTIEQIAAHKCGIFQSGVPVVYDSTNPPDVVKVIEEQAKDRGAGPLYPVRKMPKSYRGMHKWNLFCKKLLNRRAHRANIACAWEATRLLLTKLGLSPPRETLLTAVMRARWPGRMQQVNLVNLLGRDKNVLVDGAHNELGGESLGHFVDKVVRIDPKTSYDILPITWVLAATKTKDAKAILQYLLKSGDRVVTVEFGPVDGMPFVEPMASDKLAAISQDVMASNSGTAEVKNFGSDIEGALKYAVDVAGEHPVVAAGSLYLVSDIFRLLKKANERPGAVPVEDIWTGEVKKVKKEKEKKKPVSEKNKSKGRTIRPVVKSKGSKNKEKPKI